jgi:hypothetical protein
MTKVPREWLKNVEIQRRAQEDEAKQAKKAGSSSVCPNVRQFLDPTSRKKVQSPLIRIDIPP